MIYLFSKDEDLHTCIEKVFKLVDYAEEFHPARVAGVAVSGCPILDLEETSMHQAQLLMTILDKFYDILIIM